MSTTVDLGKITASVTVGTTTTGAAGTNASVSNSGTTQDAVLNFTIPRGAQGVQGPQGIQGNTGPAGPTGPQGPMGDVAVITPEQQAAFTMYSEPGQNTNGPMTQKAVTDNFAEIGDGSQESDLDIEDQFGNKIVRFMDGNVKTKNFDSSTDAPTSSGDTTEGDLEFADAGNNVLMRLYDGHVKTKEFNSSSIEKKNISSALWTFINNTHLVDVFKKVCCIGDSLTAGYTKIGSVNIGSAAARPLKNNWPAYMENLTGGNVYDNIAIGSSTTHHWRYEDGPQSDYKPDFDLANDSSYEAYIVALGVNDERTRVTVGTMADIASNKSSNADTFCGNYDYIVRQLMEWNAKAHIFCLTIPLLEGNNVIPYNTIINDIGNLYSNKVHVISLEGEDVDLSWIAANFANGHYCPIVYNYFASIIYRRISNVIWNNNTIFRETPYN